MRPQAVGGGHTTAARRSRGAPRPTQESDPMTADDDEPIESTFSSEVGKRLRSVRRIRGLSLDDVERESGGRWSASAVGAYERGFRNLSLPRLRDLAGFYDVPMGVLLGEEDLGTGARGQGRLVLDLVALQTVPDAESVLRYLR